MFEQLKVLGGPYKRFQCFCWVRISMKLFLNIECYLYEVIFEKIGLFLDSLIIQIWNFAPALPVDTFVNNNPIKNAIQTITSQWNNFTVICRRLGTFEHYIFYLNQRTVEIVSYDRLTGTLQSVMSHHSGINSFQIVVTQEPAPQISGSCSGVQLYSSREP